MTGRSQQTQRRSIDSFSLLTAFAGVGFLIVVIVAYRTKHSIEFALAVDAVCAWMILGRRGFSPPTRLKLHTRTTPVGWIVVLVVLSIPTPLLVFIGYDAYGWIGGATAGCVGLILIGRPLAERRRRLRRLVLLAVVSDEPERKAVADLLRAQGIRCAFKPDEPFRLLTDRDDLARARATLARE
jgi:hypothetical protein